MMAKVTKHVHTTNMKAVWFLFTTYSVLFASVLSRKSMKVHINCGKCKNKSCRVTDLYGVKQVLLDEEKSLLMVVGTMDPVCITEQLRKIKQKPVVVNIRSRRPLETTPEKKPEPECCKPCLSYNITWT